MTACATKIEARRNGDLRITYTPPRKFTFAPFVPVMSIRDGATEVMSVTTTATANGSSLTVVGDSLVLTMMEADLAIIAGAGPTTERVSRDYDIVLADQTGLNNWMLGGQFVVLGINDPGCSSCGDVEISLDGQCVQVSIEGGNIGVGASISLAELNAAVEDAENAAEEAQISASQAAAAAASVPAMLAGKLNTDGTLADPGILTNLPYTQTGTGAVSRSQKSKNDDILNARDFGVTADGVTDDTLALQKAVTAANGRRVFLPEGTIRITSSIVWQPASYVGVFGVGAHIHGQGIGVTVIDNQSGGAAFRLITASSVSLFRASLGVEISDLTITSSAGTAGTVGIYASAQFNLKLRQVHIIGMGSHGVELPVVFGDNDASNMVGLEHVRIENCGGWGIKADGGSGFNELSFTYLLHTFVQNCGTTSASATPPSGGIIFKGQQFLAVSSACVLNKNVGLFIPSGAGACQNVDLQSFSFENNLNRGLYVAGCSAFKARNIQFYNSAAFVATNLCEFDGSAGTIRKVDIDGVYIRASATSSPCTAFKISGGNTDLQSSRVRNVVWDDYDYAGQVRFDGWQFDYVPLRTELIVTSATNLTWRPPAQFLPGQAGAISPIRLRWSAAGTSTTGEWVEYHLPASGISISNASLAADTTYYVYVFASDSSAPVAAMEISTTAPAIDTATGYPLKTGDGTRLCVGRVRTNASSQFLAADSGWVNPSTIPASGGGTASLWKTADGRLRVKDSAALPVSFDDSTSEYVATRKNFLFAFDPPSVPANGEETVDVAVTCSSNDFVSGVAFAPGWGGLIVTGSVKSTNLVSLLFRNPTAAVIDLSPSTAYVNISPN